MKHKKEYIGIFLLSILLAACADMTYILLAIQTPPNAINMGISNYWQDYFFYVSQIVQGAHGYWLTHNLYTAEITTPTLLYWCNILYGKMGYLVGMSPITTFHVSNIILGSCMLMAAFVLYKKIFPASRLAYIAFIFFTFSTSLMNRLPPTSPVRFWPFQLWRAQHFMFERLSNVPNQVTQPILFFILLYLLFTTNRMKKWLHMLLIGLITILATLLHPVMIGITVISYLAATWITVRSRKIPQTVALLVGFAVAAIYTVIAFQGEPYIQSRLWEAANQTYTSLPFLLKSIGPIVPFVLLGLFIRRKSYTSIERFGVVTIFGCYTAFMFPNLIQRLGITNVRILYPGMYIFLGWFAAVGLDAAAQFLSHRMPVRKGVISIVLILLFFVSISPTLWWELEQRIPDITQYDSGYYFMPKSTYDAYQFLEKTKPYTDVVLAGPYSQSDVRVPALTGHQTVAGHPLTTIRAEEKNGMTKQFFNLTMPKDSVIPWLTDQRVTYVLFTDGDGDKKTFEDAYPFLTPIYTTTTATVFMIRK